MKRALTLSILTSAALLAAAPNAGTILRQLPKTPSLEKVAPLPKVQQEYTPPMQPVKSKVKVLINRIVIKDNTVFSEKVLHTLVSSFEQKSLPFADMQKIADTITRYYRSHGYFVARAYLPAQDLDNHILTIEVIEGKYGKFAIENGSLVKSSALRGYMPQSGTVVSLSSLDRGMLLIDDLAGARIVKANIHPGTKVGTSDFSLSVAKEQRVQAYAMLDNYGTKATGEYRFNGGVILNSLTGYGDSLSFSTLDSFSGGLRNLGGAYTLPLGYSGLKLDLQASVTKYRLQDMYSSLNAYGEANVLDAGLSYPLIRSEKRSLYIKTDFGSTFMSDTASGSESKKHVNALSISLSGNDAHTLFFKPASFSGDISYTRGDVIMDNADATANDSLVNTQGYFSKLLAQVSEKLYLTNKLSMKVKLVGQTSFSKNLDSSQKLTLGGEYAVRAYTNSELSADKGIIASLEADYRLPSLKGLNHTAGVFIDGSKAYENANPYTGVVNNERELNDIGVSYTASYRFINLQASFAHGFGPDARSSVQQTYNDNKFFFQAGVVF
jgi:hemolysin activation/secretion protein